MTTSKGKKKTGSQSPATPVSPVASAENAPDAALPIVGIGTSAGGLEAFEQFFRACPADSGMAFVLVPHLDPDHESLLTEILQRATAMPVVTALDQVAVASNHVYIIPPNREMAIRNGVLQLSLPEQARRLRKPINAFLRSLAEDQAEDAIGVILSGTAPCVRSSRLKCLSGAVAQFLHARLLGAVIAAEHPAALLQAVADDDGPANKTGRPGAMATP